MHVSKNYNQHRVINTAIFLLDAQFSSTEETLLILYISYCIHIYPMLYYHYSHVHYSAFYCFMLF